jgi:predicted mannosyl-3-phosphoglycerate phosphatase (HAD superfamily)
MITCQKFGVFMHINSINKSTNFGYKLSDNFRTATQNENFLYNVIKLSKAKKAEQIRYNKLVEEIEENGPSDMLDINENGVVILGDKELENTYFDYNIGKCISYNALKNIYNKLFKKGKNNANQFN